MREKRLQSVLTFHSTTDAMAMEHYCSENGVAGRLIPVPRLISASCGMAWIAPAERKEEVILACENAKIKYEKYTEMFL